MDHEAQQGRSVHEVHQLAADVLASCRQLVKTSTLSLDLARTVDALVAVEQAGRALEAARLVSGACATAPDEPGCPRTLRPLASGHDANAPAQR